MTALFIERENEILKTIRSLADSGLDFVVIGGYAVSGFGRHRFSVDLDVVIDEKDLDAFRGSSRKGGLGGTLKEPALTRSTEADS